MRRLFKPVDIAWLVAFRIAFGTLMVLNTLPYFVTARGRQAFVEPDFHFTYLWFQWVRPWPEPWLDVHFAIMTVCAAAIAVGLFYRAAAAVFLLGFTYAFLFDQAVYLNHYYLISLVALLMIFLPAHRACSVDAWRRPALRARTVPAWTLFLVRWQIGLVYFFAAVAKMNGDWLRGEPLRSWLTRQQDELVLGKMLTGEWAVYGMSYGGLLLDLLIAPLLLWRRTRLPAFVVVLFFHLANHLLFNIGIFPWMMIAVTLAFFDPDWPRRLLRWRRAQPVPVPPPAEGHPVRAVVATAVLAWVGFQVLIPLRHHLYPGRVAWTEEGHRFSWRMKLRSKSGWARFIATDPDTGKTWVINPSDHLTRRQLHKMNGVPDMIHQFARHLGARLRADGKPNVEIRVRVLTSLNGRPHQLLIDPDVDLSRQPRTLWPSPWILPLDESRARS